MAVSHAVNNHALPKLALHLWSVDDDKFEVEHFTGTVLAAFEEPALAGAAGANGQLESRNRPVRNQLDTALFRCGGVIVSHS